MKPITDQDIQAVSSAIAVLQKHERRFKARGGWASSAITNTEFDLDQLLTLLRFFKDYRSKSTKKASA